MTVTVLNLNGYSDGTDISVVGFNREYQTPAGAFTINSDGLLDTTEYDGHMVTYDTTANAHSIEVTYADVAVSSIFPCCVNVIEYHSWYGVRYYAGQYSGAFNVGVGLYLSQTNTFTNTYLASVPMTLVNGDRLKLEYKNGKLTVYKNGVAVVGMIDIIPQTILPASTKVGMRTGSLYGDTHANYIDVITIESIPPASITSVNSGNPVKVGSTFSSTVANFTGVTSGTLGGKALTGLSYSSNTITATLPAYVDTGTYFEPDTNQTLTFVNGSETASLSVPTDPPVDMLSVVLSSPNMVDQTYLTPHIPTATNNDRIIYPPEGYTLGVPNFTVAADGKVTCATAGLRVLYHWNSENYIVTQLNVTVNEVGDVVDFGLTSSGLSSSGLTSSGLTSR